MERIQKKHILTDLKKKMVFLTGPRQVGKTWLARDIAKEYKRPLYLNYDSYDDREIIKKEAWPETTDFLVLDEIHKMPQWKNFIKGVYDTRKNPFHILVTGSARLETFRQSGDALTGRFFRQRLLPLSYREVPESGRGSHAMERMLKRSGFPEPYLAPDDSDADRWRIQYLDGLIRIDILDFERVHELKAMQMLVELLRRRVGSPVSFNSIAQDLAVSPTTVRKYIEILESLFIVFRVTPYSNNIARSLLKEPKIYFYDVGLVADDQGARFENLVAISLLKHTWALVDCLGKQADVYYIRTKDKQEIDFCLTEGDKPTHFIEVKTTGPDFGKSLRPFHEKYGVKSTAVFRNLKHDQEQDGIQLARGDTFLGGLYM